MTAKIMNLPAIQRSMANLSPLSNSPKQYCSALAVKLLSSSVAPKASARAPRIIIREVKDWRRRESSESRIISIPCKSERLSGRLIWNFGRSSAALRLLATRRAVAGGQGCGEIIRDNPAGEGRRHRRVNSIKRTGRMSPRRQRSSATVCRC